MALHIFNSLKESTMIELSFVEKDCFKSLLNDAFESADTPHILTNQRKVF